MPARRERVLQQKIVHGRVDVDREAAREVAAPAKIGSALDRRLELPLIDMIADRHRTAAFPPALLPR